MNPPTDPDAGLAPTLSIESLSFGHGDQPLFEGLSAELGPGLTLVRGGDGRGKTTLLRLLAGAIEPRSGRIFVRMVAGGGEEEVTGHALSAGSRIFFVTATPQGNDEAIAGDCLRDLRLRSPGLDDGMLDALVEDFALAPHLGKRLFMLSTGTRRKLWIAAAFASGAPLTLIDDPFGALDRPSIAAVRERIADAGTWLSRMLVVAHHDHLAGASPARTIDLGD